MAQGDQDRDLNRNENLKISSFEWHRFLIGCGLLTISVGFAVWGFSKEVLYDHQRQILVWILPLAAGFSASAFAGSISVKSRKLIPGVAVTATSGFAVWLLCFWFLFPAPDSISRPLVVLMDSTLPQVVYDSLTRSQGGTNSDDISEIIDDLPIRITTEKTSLIWRREEQVRKMEPDLIVIHLSCFYERTNVLDSDERFRSFLRYMKNSKTKFLVYTRGLQDRKSVV